MDLSTGITREDYFSNIDPYLTRPLTLGGVRPHPKSRGDTVEYGSLAVVQLKPKSASTRMRDSRT